MNIGGEPYIVVVNHIGHIASGVPITVLGRNHQCIIFRNGTINMVHLTACTIVTASLMV